MFTLSFLSKNFFCTKTRLQHIPVFWKRYEDITLYNREQNYTELYDISYREIKERDPARPLWHVIYASGMSRIGKTAFGLNAPSKLLEIARKKKNDKYVSKILEDPIYLLIDSNGGGDGYTKEDMHMNEPSALGWRLLARACGMAGGVRDLREIIKSKKREQNIQKHISNYNLMQCKELIALLSNIETLNDDIYAKHVILALAKDYRSIKGLKEDENVTIFIHHDEHQLIYEKRKTKKKLDDDEAVESHKEYLYDLCTLRGDGNNTWCRANNITLFPIFTGTSGDVLIGLMKVTQFTKKTHFSGHIDSSRFIHIVGKPIRFVRN